MLSTWKRHYHDHQKKLALRHRQSGNHGARAAIQTAQLLGELGKTFNPPSVTETEKIAGARGCTADENIRIHSIRLPGYIAHQEIIFGAPGEIYLLRHDTTNRSCYMPGVLLAIRKILGLKSLVYGLEKIL